MFGGLTKTTSRFALAVGAGLLMAGWVGHAKAADLGGDCCADLEERVAELEATTVRKGNRKVSVTVSGWIHKALMIWDDGDETNAYVVDKFNTLASHFKFSGAAQIKPGWSAGYELHIEAPVSDGLLASQFQDNSNGLYDASQNTEVLLSDFYIKSDRLGTVRIGKLSQASDNLSILPDVSGTLLVSITPFFEGNGFFLRPSGAKGAQGLTGATWGTVLSCQTGLGIGADCNGVPADAIRYDTPTFGGFSASVDWGEDDFWDVALRFAKEWNSIKVAAAVGYSEVTDENYVFGATTTPGFRLDTGFFQIGGSIMHTPTGLWVYAAYNKENNSDMRTAFGFGAVTGNSVIDDGETFHIKAGVRKNWFALGATNVFGEYGRYDDYYSGGLRGVANNACASGLNSGGAFALAAACANPANASGVEVTNSEITRYGAAVMQNIDAAAMFVYFRWQHMDLDLDLVSNSGFVNQNFEDLDIFLLGGQINF